MVDAIISVLGPILGFLSNQYGVVGTILGYSILVVMPIVSVVIEVMEAVVKLTSSTDDDEVISKIKAVWVKVMPWMELLPHANIPLSPVLVAIVKYSGKAVAAIVGAVKGWLGQ